MGSTGIYSPAPSICLHDAGIELNVDCCRGREIHRHSVSTTCFHETGIRLLQDSATEAVLYLRFNSLCTVAKYLPCSSNHEVKYKPHMVGYNSSRRQSFGCELFNLLRPKRGSCLDREEALSVRRVARRGSHRDDMLHIG